MFNVRVALRTGSERVSPTMSKEEAERDLAAIRAVLGTSDTPDVSWITAMGKDILAADILEESLGVA